MILSPLLLRCAFAEEFRCSYPDERVRPKPRPTDQARSLPASCIGVPSPLRSNDWQAQRQAKWVTHFWRSGVSKFWRAPKIQDDLIGKLWNDWPTLHPEGDHISDDELHLNTEIEANRHAAGLLSQGWYPSAIHLAKSSIRDCGQGPPPLGGGGGMTAPPMPRILS